MGRWRLTPAFFDFAVITKYGGIERFQESLHPSLSCPFSERPFFHFLPPSGALGCGVVKAGFALSNRLEFRLFGQRVQPR